MLDLRNAQQGGDDGQRLVEPGDRLIRNRPQFLERPGVLTAAFEAYPHPGQWRPQIVGNVVADSGDLVDESLDLVEHAVDDDGELVEWIVETLRRQALPQIAADDTFDLLVDRLDALLGTQAQERPGRDGKAQGGQQAQRQRLLHDLRQLRKLVDVAADHQRFAIRQAARDRTGGLLLAPLSVDPDDDHAPHAGIGLEAGRQALDVAGDSAPIGAEQGREPDAARILPQAIIDRLQPPLRSIGCYRVHLVGNRGVDARRHVGGRLPVDEAEQQEDANGEGAGDHERPAERGRADELRQAHGE